MKRVWSVILSVMIVISMIPIVSVPVGAAFNRATDITYSYSDNVSVGKIRYIAQQYGNGGNCPYFNSSYWVDGNGKQGCYAASTSMAFSYLGVNVTPKKLKGIGACWDSNPGTEWNDMKPSSEVATKVTNNTGVAVSSIYTATGVNSFNVLDTAINDFQNGNGTYSPPIVKTTSGTVHYFLVTKKIGTNKYEVVDPLDAGKTEINLSWFADLVQYKRNTPVLGNATITNGSSLQAGDVKFTWNAASGATSYNIKIWKLNSNETETLLHNDTGVSSGCTYNLENGNYKYVVQAVNSSGYTETEARLYVGQRFVPSSYFFFNGNLYEIYEYQKSWEEAKKFCDNIGGHLVTITSEQEQKVIEEKIQYSQNNYLWVGASDTETEGTFKWVTDEAFDYTNWDTLSSNEPNDANGGEDYAAIKTVASITSLMGSWNDAASSCSYGFICEYDNIDNMEPIASTTYNGHSYDLYDYKLPAIQAELFAQRSGGHLVSLNSAEEEDVVEVLMEKGSMAYYWLGAMRFDVNSYKYRDNILWSTGEEITYTNYGKGEPNNSGGEEWFVECIKNIEDYVAWNDVSNIGGQGKTSGFIIEKPIEYSIEYNFDNATNGPENQVKIHGETLPLSDVIPQKNGYKFLGWALSSNATTAEYAPGADFTLNQNVVLHAVWQSLGELSEIKISSLPTKTTYRLGEHFDAAGLVVATVYSTGITDILNGGYTISGLDSSTVGPKKISVYYEGKTAEFTVNVTIDSDWSDWTLTSELPEFVKNAPDGIYEVEYADGYKFSEKIQKTSGYAYEAGWTMESKTQIGSTEYGDWGLMTNATSDTQSADYHTIVTNDTVSSYGCYAYVTSDKKTYWCEDSSEWGDTKYTQEIFIYSSVALPDTGYEKDTSYSSFFNGPDGSYICPQNISKDNPDKFKDVYLMIDRYEDEINYKILDSFTSGKDVSYWWPINDPITLYRTATEKYQYTHIRWTDWSEMTREQIGASDSIRVEVTDNAYVRYRLAESTVDGINDTIAKIKNIPLEITIEDKEMILSAQQAYENLKSYEQNMIDSQHIAKLNNAIETLARIDVPKHTETEVRNRREATCIAEGYTGDIYCLICGELVSSGESIPITGHKNTVWIVEQEPNCTETGYKDEYCLDCTELIGTETIPAIGHLNTSWKIEKQPTCTEEGSRSEYCGICDEVVNTEGIPAKGHIDRMWVIKEQPTCDKNGCKDQYCLECAELIATEEIPATGHSYSTVWTIDLAPNCTEEGSKSYHCTVCGDKTDITAIASLGHDFKVISTADEHPHTISYKCSRCTETKQETSTSATCAVCNFTYTNIDSATCRITGYKGSADSFVIPANISGRAVTTTTTGAFKNNTTLTSVRIENGVQGLGSLAFLGCKSLSKIVIPESVTSIGTNAFYNCASNFTIYCYGDTYAMQYAIDNSLNYVVMDIGETENSRIDYDNELIFISKSCLTSLDDILYVPSTGMAFAEASHIAGNYEFLGTGSKVTVFDGSDISSEYTIVVEGDTNGDSVCDGLDVAQIALVANGHENLDGAYAVAADTNYDDMVDVNDYQSIVNKAVA